MSTTCYICGGTDASDLANWGNSENGWYHLICKEGETRLREAVLNAPTTPEVERLRAEVDRLKGERDRIEASYVRTMERDTATIQHIATERDAARAELAALREKLVALKAALQRCARSWGWLNEGDPPIVSELPDHPAVAKAIDEVRHSERARYRGAP